MNSTIRSSMPYAFPGAAPCAAPILQPLSPADTEPSMLASARALDRPAGALYVALVLQQDSERVFKSFPIQRPRPVECFGNARRLFQIEVAQPVDKLDGLACQLRRKSRYFELNDAQFLFFRGIVYEEIQAAPLERFAQLPRVIRRQNNRGLLPGGERPELGYGDLKIAEHLQEKRFELGIGAVDLVDQQHHRVFGQDRAQEGALEQK